MVREADIFLLENSSPIIKLIFVWAEILFKKVPIGTLLTLIVTLLSKGDCSSAFFDTAIPEFLDLFLVGSPYVSFTTSIFGPDASFAACCAEAKLAHN